MANKIEKVVVLGLDSAIASRVYRYAQEGKLPTLQKLMQNGVWSPNCLVPFPTITPPNWTTIATGAWPGTHGITDFDGHIPGDPLDEVHQQLDAREIQAEAIWTAAEKQGKKTSHRLLAHQLAHPAQGRLPHLGLRQQRQRLAHQRAALDVHPVQPHPRPADLRRALPLRRASGVEEGRGLGRRGARPQGQRGRGRAGGAPLAVPDGAH